MAQRTLKSFFVTQSCATPSAKAGNQASAQAPQLQACDGSKSSALPDALPPIAQPAAAGAKRKAPEPDSDVQVVAATAAAPLPRVVDLAALAAANLELCRRVVADARSDPSKPLPLQQLLVEPSWQAALAAEMAKPYFAKLSAFVDRECRTGVVYPPQEHIFRALNSCPLDQVRVVILGQDPYPNVGQAMGLCFSVNRGQRVPQSLVNIHKELEADLGCPVPGHGDLSAWSTQGVLMLNTLLTVRAKAAASHKKQGWEAFTDAAIAAINRSCRGVVFLLWGKPAQQKAALVDKGRHHVLTAPHPSPLAQASGHMFVGCRHFSQANTRLAEQGKPTIEWCIPP